MNYGEIAAKVLAYVGGATNVEHAMTCLTRLRLTLGDLNKADLESLRTQKSVLGVVKRNSKEVEVVFGPSAIETVAQEFCKQAHIELESPSGSVVNPLSSIKATSSDSSEPEHDEVGANATSTKPRSYTISAGHRQSYRAQQRAAITDGRLVKEDIDALKAFLSENGEKPVKNTSQNTGKSVLVINGPNINMLGTREPDVYGRSDYATLVRICKAAAAEAGFDTIRCFQSNHEGSIVDEIQCALGVYDGIVINPA